MSIVYQVSLKYSRSGDQELARGFDEIESLERRSIRVFLQEPENRIRALSQPLEETKERKQQ